MSNDGLIIENMDLSHIYLAVSNMKYKKCSACSMVLASPPCRVSRISPPPAGFVDHQVKNSTFHIPDQHNTTAIDSYRRQRQIEPAGKG